MSTKSEPASAECDVSFEKAEDSDHQAMKANDLMALAPPAEGLAVPTLVDPDALTIALQVIDTITVPPDSNLAAQADIKMGPIAHYKTMDARDGLESSLARVAVGLTNAAMESLARAAKNDDWLKAREVELTLSVKLALALAEVVKAFDNHRGRGNQMVAVGQVNVQSGGQAIVGNVQRPEQSKASAALIPRRPNEEE